MPSALEGTPSILLTTLCRIYSRCSLFGAWSFCQHVLHQHLLAMSLPRRGFSHTISLQHVGAVVGACLSGGLHSRGNEALLFRVVSLGPLLVDIMTSSGSTTGIDELHVT